MTPRLSVIVVTQERHDVLAECLSHLARQDTSSLEAIVVDSSRAASTAPTEPWVRYRWIGPLRENMQLARNVGILLARAPAVAFIDDDCFVKDAWASEILALIDRPGVGAVGGRVVDRRWAEAIPRTAEAGQIAVVRDGSVVSGFFSLSREPLPVHHLPGGNAAVKREVARSLGGFDPTFGGTNFREDTDFYYRVHRAGYRVLYSSTIEVYHAAASKSGHGFTDRDARRVRYWEARNNAQFLRHTVGLPARVVLSSQLRFALRGILRRSPAVTAAILRGLVYGTLARRVKMDALAQAAELLRHGGEQQRGEPESA